MSTRTVNTAYSKFQELPDKVRLTLLLFAYTVVALGLVYTLGLDGGGTGGVTGPGGVSSLV